MKYSGAIGVIAGLVAFGIGCAFTYPLVLIIYVLFGLIASFRALLHQRKNAMPGIIIAGFSMWLTFCLATVVIPPRMASGEVWQFFTFVGIVTAAIFFPAILTSLILRLKANKASPPTPKE